MFGPEKTLRMTQAESEKNAAGMFNSWSPEYAKMYKEKQMQRFGEEVGAGRAMLEGAMSGRSSQALGAQALGLGQTAAEQAIRAASGNPLAQRAGMYGGAQQAFGVAQQGAGERLRETEQARSAMLEAQLRQLGYGAGLSAMDFQRQQLQEQARRQLADAYTREALGIQGQNQEQEIGTFNAIAGMLPVIGGLFGGK